VGCVSEQIGAPVNAKVLFGGDDNPEQCPEDVCDRDYQATRTGAH
jgi:hypothetical protein